MNPHPAELHVKLFDAFFTLFCFGADALGPDLFYGQRSGKENVSSRGWEAGWSAAEEVPHMARDGPLVKRPFVLGA